MNIQQKLNAKYEKLGRDRAVNAELARQGVLPLPPALQCVYVLPKRWYHLTVKQCKCTAEYKTAAGGAFCKKHALLLARRGASDI